MHKLSSALVGELLGTFLLVLFGAGSVACAVLTGVLQGLWQVATVWGFGVAIAIYCSAALSGAHLNPVVSLAFAVLRPHAFPRQRLVPYWLAHLAGAMLAGLVVARPRAADSPTIVGRLTVEKRRVLFLCTHNSARSQMAEGLLRHLAGDRFEAFSAGTEATHVRPLAIEAMADLGIDLSSHESKTLDRYLGEPFDAVVTVCDQAAEACPVFPGARRRLHWSFPDPSKATGTHDEQLAVYRRVRDDIARRIQTDLLT